MIGGAFGLTYGGLTGSLAGAYIFNGVQEHGLAFLFPNGLPRWAKFEDLWRLSDAVGSYR
ncbi:hypothetical protein CFB46_09855 [Burkholderia sp. HI2761]|nr:hypothetical protein CFB46_09855 [Burkholderia sp. HI2761]